MQKWNVPTEKAQRVAGKNGVICLFIMFTLEVMIIKISKMAHFLYFCWCQQKASQSLDKIFTCIWKILFSFLRKCYGLLDSELQLARHPPLKIPSFICLLTEQFFNISTLDISQTITPKPMNHTIFWKNVKDLLGAFF